MTAELISVPATPHEIGVLYDAIGEALVDEDGLYEDPPCAQSPDLWFPEAADGQKGAAEPMAYPKLWCGMCKAQAQCLEYAIAAGEKTGIWGGVYGPGRTRARRRPR